jgi:hypothetical protein
MENDKELAAMMNVNSILADLDEAAVSRIILWAAARYGVVLGKSTGPAISRDGFNLSDDEGFQDVASLFDAASPKTEPEKVLVVGYWLQEIRGQGDVEAHAVNSELKNLGHGASNITRALENLINRKPRLVIQTRKSGSTQQARKKYKITVEGIRTVKSMLSVAENE